MNTNTLSAEKRNISGRKVNSLRKNGVLPANLFGKNVDSISLMLSLSEFSKVYEQAGETGIINLLVNSNEHPVLVSDVQVHPVTGEVIHVDFRQINLKEKVTATVPIEIEGVSPAEKQGIGTMVQQLNELDVEALPLDLPEKLVADASILLEVDQSILVKDLKYDSEKVKVDADPEEVVVKIEELQKEEIVVPVATEETPAEVPIATAQDTKTEEAPKEE